MAALFCVCAIVLLLACAIFFFTTWRKIGCWLLVLFPLALVIGILLDMARGIRTVGQAGFRSDAKILPYFLALLLVTVIAAIRPKWGWLFWIAWILNALCCAIAVFLTFFWKIFS